MIHQQGAEYKDSTAVEEAIVEEAASKKGKNKLIIAIAAFGLAFLIGVPAVVLSMRSNAEAPPAPTETDTGVIVGDDEYWAQFEVEDTFQYTSEEVAQLRAWGYTGDEIEENESNEVPATDLIAASKQAQEEARATLSNPESPEYQALLNNTWLGQQALSLPAYTEGTTEGAIYYNTHTFNADYDKVPAHGHSLYLKVYMEDGSYAFMECPLLRYMQLPDSGNIVVQYQTATLDGVTIVFSMKEVTVQ